MSLPTRRTISWLGTLAVFVACGAGVTRLPGSGGLIGELRWGLARASTSPTSFDHASFLLLTTELRGLGNTARVMEALLDSENPQVVHAALVLISGRFFTLPDHDSEAPEQPTPAMLAFANWFERTSPDERLAYLPYTLLAGASLRERWHSWPELTRDDARWILAGTLERSQEWRIFADRLVFGSSEPLANQRTRLLLLDQVEDPERDRSPYRLQCRHPDEPYALHADDVAAYLSDPHERVRWAAGRILTVAGDPRGLPAFREWLKSHPRIPPGAEKMLTGLFGPDWRKSP